MQFPREIWSRLRSWVGRASMEREMEEEMRFHLDQATEKNVRAGMPPETARRAAVLSFGGMERFKEESRDESRPRLLEELAQDLRYGLRTLRRNPGFTFVTVSTLAGGRAPVLPEPGPRRAADLLLGRQLDHRGDREQ